MSVYRVIVVMEFVYLKLTIQTGKISIQRERKERRADTEREREKKEGDRDRERGIKEDTK